ncbi:MAG TPA: helix-turn-helix domain-containing protein [Rectinemataceae bacterium]|nr:helix-turn-helix domain-containing protein [Rectinemataceae bacterium]
MDSDDKLMSASEAARLLGIKIATLYQWTSRKAIPFVRISRNMIKFNREELQAWIEARKIEEIGGKAVKPRSQTLRDRKDEEVSPSKAADDPSPKQKGEDSKGKGSWSEAQRASLKRTLRYRAYVHMQEMVEARRGNKRRRAKGPH